MWSLTFGVSQDGSFLKSGSSSVEIKAVSSACLSTWTIDALDVFEFGGLSSVILIRPLFEFPSNSGKINRVVVLAHWFYRKCERDAAAFSKKGTWLVGWWWDLHHRVLATDHWHVGMQIISIAHYLKGTITPLDGKAQKLMIYRIRFPKILCAHPSERSLLPARCRSVCYGNSTMQSVQVTIILYFIFDLLGSACLLLLLFTLARVSTLSQRNNPFLINFLFTTWIATLPPALLYVYIALWENYSWCRI